ncbi:MAG: hypothetical protein ABJL67_03155 [Sulfitobacter sp.]
MSKITDKFLKDFKVIKAQLKNLSPAAGEKMKKGLISNLDKTWAAEDVMKEAVKKVRLAGLASKKSADFIKEGEVSGPMKTWQAALKIHTSELGKLDSFHQDAKKLETELTKRVAEVEKEIKKTGGNADKPLMAALKEAKAAIPVLKKASGVFGTLQGHVVMYGMNMQRAVDGIVKNALAEVDPKEFPEPYKAENRAKTAKTIKRTIRTIEGLIKEGRKKLEEGDLKKAANIVTSVTSAFEVFEKFEKEAKVVTGKMKKELKTANDSQEILKLIKIVAVNSKKYSALVDGFEDDVEAAEREAE